MGDGLTIERQTENNVISRASYFFQDKGSMLKRNKIVKIKKKMKGKRRKREEKGVETRIRDTLILVFHRIDKTILSDYST